MIELNNQTKKKIEEMKEMITGEIPVKEIIKNKFGSSPKMKKWLEKNYIYFSNEELDYLEYSAKVEVLEELSIDSVEPREEKNISLFKKNIVLSKEDITKMTEKQRAKLLMSDDVIGLLINLLDKDKRENDLDIPVEYMRLKDIKIKNCRISDSIYKNFVKCCEKNNYTITAVLNFILDDFTKKHSK